MANLHAMVNSLQNPIDETPNPKISVVMPVYNAEKYLAEAMDSILGQTFADFEFLIVVEYGTNKATLDILASYAEKDLRIKLIKNSERLGISASMNIGFDISKGEYIARMDADDISLPTRFEKQTAYMDAHPEIGILGVKPEVFGAESWDWPIETDPEICRAMLLFFHPVVHPSVMLRKEQFDKHNLRYNNAYGASEDYDLWVRASEFVKISNLDEVLLRYRMHGDNATHARNKQGLAIMREIFLRLLNNMGAKISRDDTELLYSQTHVDVGDSFEAQTLLDRLDLLLKHIFYANGNGSFYSPDALFRVLHLRWMRQLLHIEYRLPYDVRNALDLHKKFALFSHSRFYRTKHVRVSDPPLISVVMPCHNSEDYIMEALWSILDQSLGDFELLLIAERDSADRTAETVSLFHDNRIKLLQNTGNPGLAQSLRFGVNAAKGKYIARMDADDIAFPKRFERQIAYFNEHPDVSLCGAGQQYFGSENRIHQPPSEHDRIKAGLLFKCDLCHTTIMFDKNDFLSRNLLYDPEHPQEDYELWHRAIWELKFANIPEVLGLYRRSENSITAAKIDRLNDAEALVIADTLKRLQVDVPPSDLILLHGWINPFEGVSGSARSELLAREKSLLTRIWEQNEKLTLYERQALADSLGERWRWATGGDGSSWSEGLEMPGVNTIAGTADDTPKANGSPPRKRGWKSAIKKLLWPFYRIVKRYTVDAINQNTDSARWATHRHTEEVRDDIRDARWAAHQHMEEVRDDIKAARRATHQRTEEIRNDLRELMDSFASQRDAVGAIRAELNAHADALTDMKRSFALDVEKAKDELTQAINGLAQTFDGRVWKAEEKLLQTFDERVWKAEENILQTFDGRVWKAEKHILQNLNEQTARHYVTRKKILLIGTSAHDNIGDHAIAQGECEFVRRYFPECELYELNGYQMGGEYDFLQTMVNADDLIFLCGGGNLGDMYLHEEEIRRRVISDFPENRIVILPQTVYFSDTEKGRSELKTSTEIYNRHKNLTVFARGEESLFFAQEHFVSARCFCAPDMATLLARDYGFERKGILACIRDSGDESGLDNAARDGIWRVCADFDADFEKSTNIHSEHISIGLRGMVVNEELKKFARRKVVVTDRLHGMIFASITRTPCVAISAATQKIREYAETFLDTEGVFFIDKDISKLGESVRSAMEIDNADCNFASEPFDAMRKAITEVGAN